MVARRAARVLWGCCGGVSGRWWPPRGPGRVLVLARWFCGTGLRGGAGRCRGLSVVGVVVAVLASVVVPAGAASAAVGGPGAPGGLSAVSVEGGVLLSWDAPEAEAGGGGVSGYRVLRRRPEQGERSLSVLVSDTGSAQTSYLDESAAVEGELFVYRVVALSGGVAGERSALARVRYAAPEPEPVVRVEPAPEPVEPEPVTDPVAEPEAVGVVWSGVLSVGFEGSVVPAMSGSRCGRGGVRCRRGRSLWMVLLFGCWCWWSTPGVCSWLWIRRWALISCWMWGVGSSRVRQFGAGVGGAGRVLVALWGLVVVRRGHGGCGVARRRGRRADRCAGCGAGVGLFRSCA